MNYVVMRLLGVSEEDKRMVKARGTLHGMGGAVNGPHWAKFWLSVLGVMGWDAVNPVPPELWYGGCMCLQALDEFPLINCKGFFRTGHL